MPSENPTATIHTSVICGTQAYAATVTAEIMDRLPAVQIVGLPASRVRETAARVRSAVAAADIEWPRKRVVITVEHYAPSIGSTTHLDLPIAMAVLVAMGEISDGKLDHWHPAGELSLAGALRPFSGGIAMVRRSFSSETDHHLPRFLLPRDVAGRVSQVTGLDVLPFDDLADVILWTKGKAYRTPLHAGYMPTDQTGRCMSEVRGQDKARRAMEISAVCGLPLLLEGAPGSGKTMLAARMNGILPAISERELLNSAQVHDAAGLMHAGKNSFCRPLRAPHHTISSAGLVGFCTGAVPRPGEASLAHAGVLFLDDLPEFSRAVINQLAWVRSSVDKEGHIAFHRAAASVRLPADFSLVAATSPCACGFSGHDSRACACSEASVERYQQRLSGHAESVGIAMRVAVDPIRYEDLMELPVGDTSETIREYVSEAAIRFRRLRRDGTITFGATRLLVNDPRTGRPFPGGRDAFDKAIIIACAVAALDDTDHVCERHVEEALELLWVADNGSDETGEE